MKMVEVLHLNQEGLDPKMQQCSTESLVYSANLSTSEKLPEPEFLMFQTA